MDIGGKPEARAGRGNAHNGLEATVEEAPMAIGRKKTGEDLLKELAMTIAREKIGKGGPEMLSRIIDAGWREVEPGVHLFYIEWGNKKGVPFVMLHGGPGAEFNETHFTLMDAKVHHVVAYDQRGCGASFPLASTMTKDDLKGIGNPLHVVHDTEHMRQTFFSDEQKIHVAGGSWGSTAALLYAEAHPDKVASLQIWSGFVGSRAEVEDMLADPSGKKDFKYQREYAWFISKIPSEKRGDIIGFLYEKIMSDDPAVAKKFSVIFEAYEHVLCAPDGYDFSKFEALKKETENDPNIVSHARLEISYHYHAAKQLEDADVLTNVGKIKDIPCRIVQGKRDKCTPPKYAYILQDRYGENCTVEEVESGHLRSDEAMKKKLQENILAAEAPRQVRLG